MKTIEDYCVGTLVKSTSGRDAGRKLLVLDIVDDLYVFVADGDLRKIEKMKKKKIKHLESYNIISTELKEKKLSNKKVTNLFLINEIERLVKSIGG